RNCGSDDWQVSRNVRGGLCYWRRPNPSAKTVKCPVMRTLTTSPHALPDEGIIPVKCRLAVHWLLATWYGMCFWTAYASAGNWPQWRGPNDDGTCTETMLPTEWGTTKNIVWKLALPGMGGATPAVWGDRIFLTSEDGNHVVLLCVSTEGRPLWKRELGSGKR